MASAVTEGKSWRFEQLDGDKKILELDGWGAPFGRPRQGAVVSDGLKIRKTETYYPESDEGPTRHVFGRMYKPWELHGRFRDRAGGVDYAKHQVEIWKAFVADAQECRISWGDILSGTGFIDEFNPGREAEEEVEWTMTVSIDKDDNAKPPQRTIDKRSPEDYASLITSLLTEATDFPPAGLPLNGNFLDAIDSLVSAVTGAVGALNDAAHGLVDFENAAFGELSRVESAATQLQGAVGALREVYANATATAALQSERASDNAKLWTTQTNIEDSMRQSLAATADVSRRVAIAKAGKAKKTYVTKGGDTWESISIQSYGTPARAGDIRAANNGGAYPTPGVEIQIPS